MPPFHLQTISHSLGRWSIRIIRPDGTTLIKRGISTSEAQRILDQHRAGQTQQEPGR